ncbi:HdeD family acid-resistance protein [Streptomyces sp. NPDC012888]|uniref:HdeD family acid-resistance protein n=1 Tax=Streptomyces sp. NPDC012888 TaxID=3364855 RepID=UPI0036A74E6F
MTFPERPAPQPTADDEPFGRSSAPPGSPGDPLDRLALVGASWKWVLVSALATLVFGVLLLVWPDKSLRVVAVLIGLYLLAAGVFQFVAAFAGHPQAGERWSRLLVAVVYVVAGVLCLRGPELTITVLALIIGMVWLVSGMLGAYAAVADKTLAHRGLAFGMAVLGIVAGIVVLCLPIESAVALTRLLGLWLVLLGLAEAAAAFALRSSLRR